MITPRFTRPVVIAGLSAATGIAVLVPTLFSSSPASGATPLSTSQILGIAQAAATRAGDPAPTLTQHSQGTRATA